MEDFRQMYLCLCEERGVEPQDSVMVKLQECRASRLDLSGLSLSTDTCALLARAFQKDTFFSELSLSDCMLSDEGAKVFLTGLFYNTTLKVLNLKGNNLKSAGAEVLGKLLAHNNTLIRLVLDWNALGVWDETFTIFCEGLSSNSVLTHLDLRNNQINHHGMMPLSETLKRNSSLKVLDLRWNNIGLLGGRCLLEALQNNHNVQQLELAGNNIPSDTLKALEHIVGCNTDRQSTLRESRSRTQVLTKEIQNLKQEKGRQFQNLMVTIDRQREEMGQSSRCTSIRISQLQEALDERKSTVNSLTAKLQMTEAALALSEQKNHSLAELIARLKVEKEQHMEAHSRERKKEHEDNVSREGKLLRDIQNLTDTNLQLKNKVEEVERKCKSQQQQLFELKQELTNSTAELKLKLAQAEDRLEIEKRRFKQGLEEMDNLRQREVEHVNRHLEKREKALQERIFKLEGQRLQLEEELSKAKAAVVAERSKAEEELSKARAQARQEEHEHVLSLEEKLRSVRSSMQEVQLHLSQQKQIVSEQQAKNSQLTIETDCLRRRIEELQQELSGKDQEKVAEVSRVRLGLQEQIGHLEAERIAQGGLKEKISALEREMKVLCSNHREALLDKDSEMSSLLEKLRLKEGEIKRIRDDEAQRATYLQNAILTYVQGSTLTHYSNPN
ncbi:leucine-rich repeat-containing protein 45 [Syngnathoides biaculeatus]|uniref:leucine-rich repeat-containing protein 45 n=1 Tax=Syngnathoides biaculeatus TaxID=300417 RepID=UPI002ADE7581|nr:leucine-rich repeat-containing protein 45 [Syngnathoides biaculeatus]XP_061666072.1 leucine-rich repeat-containing protein 45 [Syngnathoides biaculeatus]XP_061666073.1 leucine-rich repeat-containing protein 45 [Syngnathoides biaculeatus]XP_061666074.1 leucine-rich repeat-containing protein 45 [Syngnathoides biaculeatus]XP_061666075.1 leucine-rich repeat-containing protein 45 [Syngnathoides biaculeatus]